MKIETNSCIARGHGLVGEKKKFIIVHLRVRTKQYHQDKTNFILFLVTKLTIQTKERNHLYINFF